MYLISWFADGPKYENMILTPFYPMGLSYFRPFRYRNKWISEEILRNIQDSIPDLINSMKSNTLLCAKFLNSETILPIRKVEPTYIRSQGDEHYLYFQMGPFIEFRDNITLNGYSQRIYDAIRSEDREHLYHKINIDEASFSFIEDGNIDDENINWTRFVDLVTQEDDLPLGNVKNSIFFRLTDIRERKAHKYLNPSVVDRSKLAGERYGYLLKEGKYYDFIIKHRVPKLINTNIQLSQFDYFIEAPKEFIEITPDSAEISGNYQEHLFNIYVKRRSKVANLVKFGHPQRDSIEYGNDERGSLHVFNVSFFLKCSFSVFKWIKEWILPGMSIFLALFLALLADAWIEKGFCEALSSKSTILKAVSSFLVSIIARLNKK